LVTGRKPSKGADRSTPTDSCASVGTVLASSEARRPNAATILDNLDWIGSFGFLDWLREVGKHFTVASLPSSLVLPTTCPALMPPPARATLKARG
jgi:hypothetical protein